MLRTGTFSHITCASDLATTTALCLRGAMANEAFIIYGCPYTAFEAAKTLEAFVVPESDSSLYHFKSKTNLILNLVGFSGLRNVRLIGCSQEFAEEFAGLAAKYPEAGFRVSNEPRTCAAFGTALAGEPSATDIIVVERQPDLIPIAQQLAREGGARTIVIDPVSDAEQAEFTAGQDDFECSNGLARQNGLDTCCRLVKRKLGAGFLADTYSSATFITKLPYNLYPFPFPTGHLPAHTAGELVVAGLSRITATPVRSLGLFPSTSTIFPFHPVLCQLT